jgi:hypothetical protein
MKKKRNLFSAVDLKNTLWDTIQEVKAGKLNAEQANAISGQAKEIMRITKLELEVLQGNDGRPTDALLSFVGAPPKKPKVVMTYDDVTALPKPGD